MARIRSLHPGQWTDEDFVSCSAFARLLALGLRNEADDNGVFEWKPVGLKMRLFPVDNLDIVSLLSELVEHDQIAQYEMNGKKYGIIRNFGKYQRPKKPNSVHPITDQWRTYAALSSVGSVPDDDEDASVPQKTETAPQRKEEGGKGKGSRISNEILSPSDESVSEGFSEFVTGYPKAEGRNAALDEWNAAVAAGATPQSILAGLAASKAYWKKEKREERYIPNASAWLEKRGWLDHGVTHTAKPQNRFSDKTVRALVVREQSEEYASSYLDPADFDGGSMTIIAANGYACDKLKGLSCLGDYRIEKRSAAA